MKLHSIAIVRTGYVWGPWWEKIHSSL